MPGIHNWQVSNTGQDFQGMLKEMGTGLLVTELMGQGSTSSMVITPAAQPVSGLKMARSSILWRSPLQAI